MTSRIDKCAVRIAGRSDGKLQHILGAAIAAAALLSPRAQAAIVINEIYGGGGGTSPTYSKDFIELYNTGATPFDLSNYYLQYASSTATTWSAAAANRFDFPGGTTINGNDYLLIATANPSATGADLDADLFTTNMLMGTGAGKVRLVDNTISHTSQAISGPGVLDFVGYGTANQWEGTGPAPAPSLITSTSRNASHADTNDNAADFTAGTPTPTKSHPPVPAWAADADGSWNDGANWSTGSAPGAAGAAATLGSAILAPRTITLAQPVTIGSLTFSSAQQYTVAGTQTLTLDSGSSASVSVAVTAGSHVISVPIVINSDLAVAVGSGLQLSTATIDGPHAVSVTGGGTLGISTRLTATSLAVDASSKVDLGSGQAVLTATEEHAVRTLVIGGELKSSSAVPLATLGVITNSDGTGGALYSSFAGVSVAATDVLVEYTYVGDTDLSGSVDASDLANLVAGMNGHLTGWINGDTNYDGAVDDADLANLLNSLRNQGAPFVGGSGTSGAVPEPAALPLLALAAPLLSRRRRG